MPLQFAILHHTGIPEPHFDLLFETHPGSDLASWRSPAWPIEAVTPVVRIKDHRRAYLSFEGEVSRHRGVVERVAGGTCSVEVGEDAVWTIRDMTDTSAPSFTLRPAGDAWVASPI
jgi:hypothetical protein